MDKLQMIAKKYQSIMQKKYYFEIAKNQNMHQFILSFEKGDFFHLAGFQKLKDITEIQNEKSKSIVFDNIINNKITFADIEKSVFFEDIRKRLFYIENLEDLLDSNQIIFQYLENKNKASYIKADYLLESSHKVDIIFIFLSKRGKCISEKIPNMCCRSFFPMNKLDYSKNQPVYVLLKKIKINIEAGTNIIQYDRIKITEKAKSMHTEAERKSILLQLNEKRAQQAINDILSEKKTIQKNKNSREI